MSTVDTNVPIVVVTNSSVRHRSWCSRYPVIRVYRCIRYTVDVDHLRFYGQSAKGQHCEQCYENLPHDISFLCQRNLQLGLSSCHMICVSA